MSGEISNAEQAGSLDIASETECEDYIAPSVAELVRDIDIDATDDAIWHELESFNDSQK